MRLRGLVPFEIRLELIAERNDSQELARREQVSLLRGVQIRHRVAQVDEALGDIGALREHAVIDRVDRTLQKAVRDLRAGGNFGIAHRADRVDAVFEIGAVDVQRDHLLHELRDLRIELWNGVRRHGYHIAGLIRRNRLYWRRRYERGNVGRLRLVGGRLRGRVLLHDTYPLMN